MAIFNSYVKLPEGTLLSLLIRNYWIKTYMFHTVDGRNPLPVDWWFIPLFRVSTIQGGAGFRNHPQYHGLQWMNIQKFQLFWGWPWQRIRFARRSLLCRILPVCCWVGGPIRSEASLFGGNVLILSGFLHEQIECCGMLWDCLVVSKEHTSAVLQWSWFFCSSSGVTLQLAPVLFMVAIVIRMVQPAAKPEDSDLKFGAESCFTALRRLSTCGLVAVMRLCLCWVLFLGVWRVYTLRKVVLENALRLGLDRWNWKIYENLSGSTDWNPRVGVVHMGPADVKSRDSF